MYRTNIWHKSYCKIKYRLLALILAAVLFFSFQISAIASNTTTSTEQNRAIALRFAEDGWGTNPNWEKVWDELLDDNLVYHFNSSPKPIIGLKTNKEFNVGLFQGFPDIKQTIEDVVAEGDKVVIRTTLQGTNTGEFLGIPPTGKSAKGNDFTLLRFENGKVVEMWYETNLLEMINQLGLLPESLQPDV